MTDKKKFHCSLCLLGPPACGKGTAATILSDHFKADVYKPGIIYKFLREEDTETGRLVRESLADGGYCPDWLTNKITDECAAKSSQEHFIMDGYPRTQAQLQHLLENYDVDVFLHVESSYEKALKAALNRRNCKSCDLVFSSERGLSSRDCKGELGGCSDARSVCAVNSESAWEKRWDDRDEEFFKTRWDTYMQKTAPLIENIRGGSNYIRMEVLGTEPASFRKNLIASVASRIFSDRPNCSDS